MTIARKSAITMAVVALLMAALEGCSGVGGAYPSGSGRPTGVTDMSDSASPAASSEGTEPSSWPTRPPVACPDSLSDGSKVGNVTVKAGKVFGFARYFDGKCLYVDPAEFFGNEAAVKAAREDGVIGPKEDLPNPFYIRNPDREIVAVPVSREFGVALLVGTDSGVATRHFTGAQFAELYRPDHKPAWAGYSPLDNIPMELRVSERRGMRADEKYVP